MEITREVNNILVEAYEVAKKNKHELVTVEHILYAITFQERFIEVIEELKGNVDELRSNLMEYLNNNPSWEDIEVRTKVNVNDFSKGEKQIYILCLIWALIKSSGVEVPFIIDTPYARIDESHRKTLTVDYLPNISKQVIILSTNEEIDSNLYNVIKPYICDEYLLLYNESARKTEVKKGYFEV